ncbi:ATP-binding cassette domain-containing protein [Natronincola ferrireducens]|uniref:Peptide/nickel transport system ATP-binding protein n=1 Tax=Natronincola ferrireducens TaxID=393762 RepID=A0A1G9GLJ1_9FIRM|nr:ATP-binding cassette domain-containing protein [Natronincola ferrireducens]SDL01540.1 peptide/nickel transport system ATP-binding protein [Natronincola ferrireducens]
MSVLEVKGLTISYKADTTCYRYPELKLNEGECLVIMGKTGTGKTTLLNALFGLAFPGNIIYEKANLLGDDIVKAKKNMYNFISYMPQFSQSALNPCLTIRRHIEDVEKSCPSPTNNNYIQMLEELKLEADVLDKFPHQLSGGMKQRIVMLLALLKKPKLLVLDEPSTAIDAITLKIILNMLQEKKKEGIAMLMVSHDLGFVVHLADNILKLDEGDHHEGIIKGC